MRTSRNLKNNSYPAAGAPHKPVLYFYFPNDLFGRL
jgi:hypothetical protein